MVEGQVEVAVGRGARVGNLVVTCPFCEQRAKRASEVNGTPTALESVMAPMLSALSEETGELYSMHLPAVLFECESEHQWSVTGGRLLIAEPELPLDTYTQNGSVFVAVACHDGQTLIYQPDASFTRGWLPRRHWAGEPHLCSPRRKCEPEIAKASIREVLLRDGNDYSEFIGLRSDHIAMLADLTRPLTKRLLDEMVASGAMETVPYKRSFCYRPRQAAA